MCIGKKGCIHPERLKGDTKDCSAEQIAICHPKEEKHPCEEEEQTEK